MSRNICRDPGELKKISLRTERGMSPERPQREQIGERQARDAEQADEEIVRDRHRHDLRQRERDRPIKRVGGRMDVEGEVVADVAVRIGPL